MMISYLGDITTTKIKRTQRKNNVAQVLHQTTPKTKMGEKRRNGKRKRKELKNPFKAITNVIAEPQKNAEVVQFD